MAVPAIVPITMVGSALLSAILSAYGKKFDEEERQKASGTTQPSKTDTPTPISMSTPTPIASPRSLGEAVKAKPTQIPAPAQGVWGSLSPTPTIRPEVSKNYGDTVPYLEAIKQNFLPNDINRAVNVFWGESGLSPNRFHVNAPLYRTGRVVAPEDVETAKNKYPGEIIISSKQEWENLRRQYPSIDVGFTQLNTADAMNNYLSSLGKTYYGLMTEPSGADDAIKIGADLLYGKIPYTAKGWQNWVAYNNMDNATR